MSGETATFAVNVAGNFEQASLANAQAADKLADAMDEDIAVLKAMQGALRNLQSGHMGATTEAKRLKEEIAAQRSSLASNQAVLLKSGTSLRDITRAKREAAAADKLAKANDAKRRTDELRAIRSSIEATKNAKDGLRSLAGQFQVTNSAAGGFVGQAMSIKSALGKAGIAGAAVLAAVAFVAVTAAIIGATVALAAYAVKVMDARRSEMIRLEGLTKIPNWFGIAAGKASDMQAAIDRVTSSVALGRDKISEYAVSLYRMGMRGKNLDSALEGASIRASVLGEEMGSAFASMAAGAVLTGQSIQGMTQRVKSQLGGLAARQMLSFSVQVQKARENIDTMFRGVKIEGFLGAFAGITQALSQSSATGRALKVMLETMLNPIFGTAGGASNIMKRLFQGMVIGMLAVTIGVLKLRKWWRETFGEMKLHINWTNVAVYTGIALFAIMTLSVITLTAVVLTLGAAVGLVFGAMVLTIGLPFVILGAAIVGVVYAFKYLIDWGKKTWEWLKGIDWSAVGSAILNGITGPLGKLWEAGKRLGREMLKGFKSAWEIASPSKVARRMVSIDIMGGAELGANEGGKRVGKRLGKAMYPSANEGGYGYIGSGSSPSRQPREQPDNRQGAMVTIQQLIMQFMLPEGDPKTQSRTVAAEFAKLLEGALLELGAT